MTDPNTQKMVSFLLENRPLECIVCTTTVALQNKKTGEVIGSGFSCGCLDRAMADAPLSPDLGKEAKGEDYVDRGNVKGETGKKQELEESMRELKLREEAKLKLNNAREQEARRKEREEEAARKLKEKEKALKQKEEEMAALEKQAEEEEKLWWKQKLEEVALRKLKEERLLEQLKEEEAKKKEELRKLVAKQEKADSMKRATMAQKDLPRNTWTEMKYSPNLKSGAAVHIVFAWTPIDFQIICDDDNEALELLQEDLMERVNAGKLKKVDGRRQRDDVVIAEYDGAYYRARVNTTSSTQCQLTFIDYGDKTVKKYEEIYEIPEDLFRAPIYGLKVRLHGLDPTDFSVGALLCNAIDASLYKPAYSLELMKKLDMSDTYTYGILCDIKRGRILNDVVKISLQNLND